MKKLRMLQKMTGCLSGICVGFLSLMPLVQAQASIDSESPAQVVGAAVSAEEISVEHGKINTLDASPVDTGHYEIESSYSYIQSKHFWDNAGDNHDKGLAQEQALGLSVTIGVIENVDVTVSSSYRWLKDNENDFDQDDGVLGPQAGNGLGDMNISSRYRFYENKEYGLSVAYIGGITLPTGSGSDAKEIGTSQEFWSFNQALVATKDWGKWTANVDLGYALPFGDKRENARGTFRSDIAVGYQVLPWLQPEVELNYSRNILADDNDQEVIAATVGIVMPINERIRVNTGVQQGLWGRNTDKASTLYAAIKLAF